MSGPSKAVLIVFAVLSLPNLTIRSFFIQLSVISLLWVGLYQLNGWFFERLALSEHVSWIFLPAALRMIAVLVAGWVGVLGIFLGSLVTCLFVPGLSDPVDILMIASLSALAPTAALLVCARFWGAKLNLAGLSPLHLLVLGTVAAGFTAILHNIYFVMLGKVEAVLESLSAMFVGDLVGTLVVLYAAKWLLHVCTPPTTSTSP